MINQPHTFASVFRDEKTAYTHSQFSEDAIQEIEAILFDKNGKFSLSI